MTRILVTGARGFLGRHVTSILAYQPDVTTLTALSRVVMATANGPLALQLEIPGRLSVTTPEAGTPSWKAAAPPAGADGPELPGDLILANDLGGFTSDGREYVVATGAQQKTPVPWSNVLANPVFGCLVTEAGPRCTWTGNSQSRRLTAWSNDPITDPATEAVFLHDRATDRAWSLSPSPRPSGARYLSRHSQGTTSWRA